MKKPRRGERLCPTCGNVMREDVGEDCLDYYVCSICKTKIRIFHKRVEPTHKPVDLNNRFGDPEDYPTGHV